MGLGTTLDNLNLGCTQYKKELFFPRLYIFILFIIVQFCRNQMQEKYSKTRLCKTATPKIDKTKVLITIGSLIKVESIADWSF